jgi:hypothetical protein
MSDTPRTKRLRQVGAGARCWDLFQGLPRDVSRKEALALCDVHGINRNTAKSVWQRFIVQTDRQRFLRSRQPNPDPEPTQETTPANPPR